MIINQFKITEHEMQWVTLKKKPYKYFQNIKNYTEISKVV